MNRLPVAMLGSLLPLLPVLAATNEPVTLAIAEARSVAVAIRQQADFVAVPITISSDQKDTAMRFEDIRQAKETIAQMAQATPGLRVHSGPVTLSATPPGRRSALSSVSIEAGVLAQAQIYLLVPLSKHPGDVYACAVDAERFLAGIQVRGRAQVVAGQIQLAVDNPEQYRPRLLKAVADDIKSVKAALGAKATVTVDGLHAPVVVRQIDDSSVEMFIPYRVSIEAQD